MGKYLKKFINDSARVEYEDSENYLEPYVSIVDGDNTVHYNKPKETRVVGTFNVTTTTNPTSLFNNNPNLLKEIEIDGVKQPSVVTSYQFSTTGEHIVKYTLSDPTSIGDYAFQNCKSLSNVTIPNSVTTIGDGAFSYCSGLTSVTLSNSITSISDYTFMNSSGLTSIVIPDSVTSIGVSAFNGCSGLTSIVIPDSVTSIGVSAFNGCSGLTSVTIPDSVTSIGDSAFARCSGLTSVTIGSGVTSIGNNAFFRCNGLASITSLATTAPTIQNMTFYYIKTNGTLTVPSGSSGYDVWMGTGDYYLGYYNWTKVEQ